MKKYTKLLLFLFIFCVAFLGFWNLKKANEKTSIPNESVIQTFQANLTVEDGDMNPTFDISQYIGETALKATQSVLDGNIKFTGEGEKAFVTSLNGRDANDKKHEFWELDVNGAQTQVGAGGYIIENNDNVVWKISTY